MTPSPAQQLMARETRVQLGVVEHGLRRGTAAIGENAWHLEGDSFLLRAKGEHWFLYRKGLGITIERGPGAMIEEETLWLNGSIYAAIASINGLLPIHASAVAHEGRVHAFTGPSGAGKSTLAAALGQRGLALFCDDTLIFDLSDPGRVLCLPGHKRLKLWPDSIALTGAAAQEPVAGFAHKLYAEPAAGHVGTVLPLAELCFLEEGDIPAFHDIAGGERLLRLQDDHYTAQIYLAASRSNAPERFALLVRLALSMKMTRFVRPRSRAGFAEGLALAEAHVRSGQGVS